MQLDSVPEFKPSVEIMDRLYPGLTGYTIGDRVEGTMDYEVVGKSEYGVEIRLKNIVVTQSKRIKQ